MKLQSVFFYKFKQKFSDQNVRHFIEPNHSPPPVSPTPHDDLMYTHDSALADECGDPYHPYLDEKHNDDNKLMV